MWYRKRDTEGERPESKRPRNAQKFKKKFLKKKLIDGLRTGNEEEFKKVYLRL